MTVHLPTASSIERAIVCPPSQVLPQVNDGGGIDAERGTVIGRFARDVVAGEPYELALERVPRKDWQATCRNLDWKTLQGDLRQLRAEVAYAVHPETLIGREVGINLGRQYPSSEQLARLFGVPEGSAIFVGTNDLEGRKGGVLEVVCDIKTGAEVTTCSQNPQMRFHALARALATGADEVEARLLYIRADGRVFTDSHLFQSFELQLFGDALCELVSRLEQAKRDLTDGHVVVHESRLCLYCGAYPVCPAKTSLARAMLGDLQTAIATPRALTPQEGGKAWLMADEAIKLGKRVKEAMNDMARQNPLPTRVGKAVKEMDSHYTEFAIGQALQLLRDLGATQEQIDCLYVETPTKPVRELNEISKKRRTPSW